ncbi:sulfurtransferase [Kribbella sp. NBC_00889]|uniref:sulfurtransferase n=1 Tax=Kribbella sp. NBC_00889 TaxID=2975974 RepID=UPI0038653707|nr:sulfurtransferase [Kribbella sp. NBC_00889]
MAREHVLVDGDWLEKQLDDPAVVVFEVDENSGAHAARHIPGALALDWRTDLQDPLRRDLIGQDAFEQLLTTHQVTPDDTVILYGGDNNWFAAYAYWYFKLYGHRDVRLLDGGTKRWELDGRPLTDAETVRRRTPRPAAYRAQPADGSLRAYRDDVIAAIGRDSILDVRSPAEFSGEILAPAHFPQEQPQVPGHVPGAVNVPWSQAVADDGTFRTDAQLRDLYAGAGLALAGPGGEPASDIVVYCRIGERSAHSWFVLHELLDQPSVKNYDGSWVEYGSLIGVPVEV